METEPASRPEVTIQHTDGRFSFLLFAYQGDKTTVNDIVADVEDDLAAAGFTHLLAGVHIPTRRVAVKTRPEDAAHIASYLRSSNSRTSNPNWAEENHVCKCSCGRPVQCVQ